MWFASAISAFGDETLGEPANCPCLTAAASVVGRPAPDKSLKRCPIYHGAIHDIGTTE